MMDLNDYNKFIAPMHVMNEQECVLILNPRNYRNTGNMQGSLLYKDKSVDFLGDWKEIPSKEIHLYDSWTYIIETKKYYVC